MPPTPYQSGTAFFVSPTILLTAGHIVQDHKDTIVVEMPGTLEAEYFPERLFQTSPRTGHTTVICKLLGTGYPDADISVLEVVGPFKSAHYLSIEQHKFVTEADAVDVIGYPGMFTAKQVLHMHPSEDLVDRHMVRDVEALFPKRELVITHGSILFGGIRPCYRLSTVVGMSGAPVVLNGKVVGEHSNIATLLIQAFIQDLTPIRVQIAAFHLSGTLFGNFCRIAVLLVWPWVRVPVPNFRCQWQRAG